MLKWTQAEFNAAGRHVLTAAGTAVATSVLWGLLSTTDASVITDNVNTIADGVTKIAKGVAGLIGVFGPIYAGWRAKQSASPENQAKATTANVEAGLLTPADRKDLINTVGEMAEVRGVVTTQAVAMSTASEKVVSTAADIKPPAPPATGART